MRLVPKIKSENASSSKWNSNDLLVFTLSRLNIQNRVYIFAAKKGETDGNNLFASGYTKIFFFKWRKAFWEYQS